jgi:ankyrin repeat protein
MLTFANSQALHYTAESGNLDLMKYLINNGANPATLSTEGSSPLHHAAKEGHTDIISFLITEQ